MKQKFNLKIDKYCSEDSTYIVKGEISGQVELKELEKSAKNLNEKVILIEKLKVLVIMLEKATIHIHADGKLVIHGVKSVDEAARIMGKFL